MINRQRASELKITEDSDEYSESPAEGTHVRYWLKKSFE